MQILFQLIDELPVSKNPARFLPRPVQEKLASGWGIKRHVCTPVKTLNLFTGQKRFGGFDYLRLRIGFRIPNKNMRRHISVLISGS